MNFPTWLQLDVKASRSTKVIMQGLRMPGAVPHMRYERLAKEGYERNIPVYLCVDLISSGGSSVPWCLYRKERGGQKKRIMTKQTAYRSEMFRGIRAGAVKNSLRLTEVNNHPALALVENPNPNQSQAEYLKWLISFFLISGNSYEEFVAPNRKNAPPVEMYSLRPDRVEILANSPENRRKHAEIAGIVDDTALVLGYDYTVNMFTETFAAPTVLHRKFFHPTDDFYGLSPLQVAARHYKTDNLSADWNYALLQNQARPSGALIAPTTIGDDTYDRLKAELKENYGGGNSGVPMILEGGFEWQPLGLTPLEMDWLAGTRDARAQVCTVYHVAPELTGDPEHRTYNSMPEARRALWMEAIMPVLDQIRDSYNNRLLPLFGDGLYLDYDRDQIDALAEDQEKVWTRVGGAKMLSVNEQRDAIGYEIYEGDPEEDPEADVPQSLRKIAAPAGVPGADPFGGEPDPAKPEPPKAREVKKQTLNGRQKRALKRMKSAMSSHYRKQGEDLAAYLKREIGKL
jgi:HK97 family phage portal protein